MVYRLACKFQTCARFGKRKSEFERSEKSTTDKAHEDCTILLSWRKSANVISNTSHK